MLEIYARTTEYFDKIQNNINTKIDNISQTFLIQWYDNSDNI